VRHHKDTPRNGSAQATKMMGADLEKAGFYAVFEAASRLRGG